MFSPIPSFSTQWLYSYTMWFFLHQAESPPATTTLKGCRMECHIEKTCRKKKKVICFQCCQVAHTPQWSSWASPCTLWGHGPLVWFTRNSAAQVTARVLCHLVGRHMNCWSNVWGESCFSSPFTRRTSKWKGSASQQLPSSGQHAWLRGCSSLGGTSVGVTLILHCPVMSQVRVKDN